MTRINTNVSSLTAQKTLASSNAQLQTALTRLSTGLRINSGKDDPAGLIASEVLRSDIISTEKAITNTQRANQMIATADSALGQVSTLLNDIRGLVTEAANQGVLSDDQIAANQLQIDSALEAINRIAQTTSFQGKKLLDGSLDFVSTAGQVSSIEDISIEQANLGAAGQIDVNVNIAAAATKATITSSSGEAQAEAVLKFAPHVNLVLNTDDGGGNSGTYSITVKSTSLGSQHEGVTIEFVDNDTAAPTATYDAENKKITVTYDEDTTEAAAVLAALDGLDEFEAFQTPGATNTAEPLSDPAATINGTGITLAADTVTITAEEAGINFNDVEVVVETANGIGTPTASYSAQNKKLTITIDDTDATNIADIVTAIGGLSEFSAAGTGAVYGSYALDSLAVANTGSTGYMNSAFSAATNATAMLDLAASASLSLNVQGGGTHLVDIKAATLGSTMADVTIKFQHSAGLAGSERAEYDEQNKTLTVYYEGGAGKSDLADILSAIDDLDGWEAHDRTGGASGVRITDTQSTATTRIDSLEIQSVLPGADFNNMEIVFAKEDGLTAANTKAEYDAAANKLTITMDSSAATSMLQIATAVNNLQGFSAAIHNNSDSLVYADGADATATANTGTTGGNVLLDELVVEIGGTDGAEVFKFEQGASINDVVAAINLLSDSTGVSASQTHGAMSITSTQYGSRALAFATVHSEGAAGSFKTSLSSPRANGTDIRATVNGVTANADGNQFSINTSSLDLSITLAAGSTANFEFSITGGGGLFQLGPDVVSNQQARLGIQSVNTASLRGKTGRLYELKSGESASLANNPTKAAAIVDEVLNKVTSLRGRLGAFQKTTLESNMATLSDTLEALTDAQSSIRDADFAKETANLTRAQILVQSGTAVLGIANQTPQNVLSLLRG
ncbi:MAG: hypothetical protein KJZ87_16435 [Thermoguttaceae bacterium]|nr:hypothetical protein [Thermoguttaceae bacterium]